MQVTPILCLTLAAVGFTRTLPAQMLDFQGMAKAAVEQFGLEDADPSTFDFDLFVDDKFLRCRLGLFDLAIPAHEATDKDVAEDFKVLAQALLDAQGQFLTWVETEDADFKQLRSDIKTVAGFVKSWRAATLSKLAKDGGCDLLSALEPKEDVTVAAKRFAAAMGLGAPLGLQRDDQVREPVLVMPTRGLFVEFIAMCGWLRPELQSIFWQPAIEHWTNFYLDDYKVLALELAAAGDGGYRSATDMNKRTPNGMAQQVVQLSTNSLIDNYFADRIPAAFAGGLAINLVVDLYGECNTRADGDLTERRTQAIEVFIPGGNSSGGTLAKNSADSRWREKQGADRFISVLRASQKEGAETSRRKQDKLRYFELLDSAKVESQIIQAPFLGSVAKAQDVASGFEGDHIEFLRSYGSAFVWWMQNKAEKSAKKSAARFASLLQQLAQADEAGRIEELLAANYDGTKLSDESVSKDVLEGRFLAWLAKQK